jgi:uncharacterized DUF497 family protein
MPYEWDESKRIDTLVTRGVDFADINHFDWNNATYDRSDRNDEVRWVSLGLIGNRLYHVVWTERGENIRIISLRKANMREERIYYGEQQ